MDATQKFVDGLEAAAASSQGGTNRDQGPTGDSMPKTGDNVSSPHSTHDDKMWNDGGAGRNILGIGAPG